MYNVTNQRAMQDFKDVQSYSIRFNADVTDISIDFIYDELMTNLEIIWLLRLIHSHLHSVLVYQGFPVDANKCASASADRSRANDYSTTYG